MNVNPSTLSYVLAMLTSMGDTLLCIKVISRVYLS